ncbi:MAG: hypothetical protein AAFV88_03720, partial [Planctomycetota bacterium]
MKFAPLRDPSSVRQCDSRSAALSRLGGGSGWTRRVSTACTCLAIVFAAALPTSHSEAGEPAGAFVKQLRGAGYFDTAIAYLDRVDKIKGIDPEFVKAIPLEKAQTFIEQALVTRKSDDRDKAFVSAEAELKSFLKNKNHPRRSEANLQLGKLQMIRAGQLIAGEPTADKRVRGRSSYLEATKTFDGIVATLKTKLEGMRGQKIDPEADPEAAALRDQYRFEYLQSQLNAADAMLQAAKTFDDPAKGGKKQLEDAATRLAELNKKYASYVPGAMALASLGEIKELLGKKNEALDHYIRMFEQPDVDPLREPKYKSASGFIRIKLAEDPPKYKEALDRTENYGKQVRPNEATLPSVQDFRIQLAKAYLAKAADSSLKKGEISRAKSSARELLADAKKVPGPHVEETESLLADLGIESKAPTMPTAEPPKSFEDAIEKANQILSVSTELEAAIKVLEGQPETDELKKQQADLTKQITESRSIGIQILRNGLVMTTSETPPESIHQARQILAYFLYQSRRYRETLVVGNFLARNAPGTDLGLKGGLMALRSMQILLAEIPDEENSGLIRQLESLGEYLGQTWPDNPDAAAAKGMQVRLLLDKGDFASAQAMIEKMPASSERGSFKRLLGRLFWNDSVNARVQEKDEEKSAELVARAKTSLQQGLDEISGALVEAEGVEAALVLAKIHLLQGNSDQALKVLDEETYGPLKKLSSMSDLSDTFAGQAHSTELKALVGQMLASDTPDQYLGRMTSTMAKLRESFQGPEAQKNLTNTYMVLATDLKGQLDTAAPAKKAKLVDAFQVMLERLSGTTQDPATLRWIGQTLSSMGESLMQETRPPAKGQAAELLKQSIATFNSLKDQDNQSLLYMKGHSQRLAGEFKASIDTLEKFLQKNPLVLEVQVEAALAYEDWASTLKPSTAYKAYRAALEGSRKNADGENTIWGWAKISKK